MQLKFTETHGVTQTTFSDDFLNANVIDQVLFLTEAIKSMNRLLDAYISNLTDQDAVVDSDNL